MNFEIPGNCVRISVSAAHGTGKTTLIDAVLKLRPHWHKASEATRLLVPALGYNSPYEIVKSNGISIYEAMIIASWSFLGLNRPSPISKSSGILLLDRSPIDNLAYYHVLRNSEEIHHEDFLMRLTKFFIQQIDIHIFVPPLPFTVKLDQIQPVETQKQIHNTILCLYEKLGVDFRKINMISIDDRARELIDLIENERSERYRT